MRFARLSLTMALCLLAVSPAAMGQDEMSAAAAAAPTMPMAPPVLSRIPAGAMGYVVVNNVEGLLTNAEKFVQNIGMAQMVGLGEEPGMLLEMVKGQAMLGDGFNPNGGLAVVMLDPQLFGVDLLAMMDQTTQAETAPAEEPKLPIVLLVPGQSVESVFGNYPIEEAGAFSVVNLRMGPMFASSDGGYVALSPSAPVLQAALQKMDKAAGELTPGQASALAKGDLGMYLNMKIAGPLYIKMLEKSEKEMNAMAQMGMAPKPVADLMGAFMPTYAEMISQLDAVVLTGQFAETGLLISEVVSLQADSPMGKAMAGIKAMPTGTLLNKLPSLPYVLAIGAGGEEGAGEAGQQMAMDMIDKLMATDVLAGVPQETKDLTKSVVSRFKEQVTSYQFVGGGAPDGSGVFGLAWVLQCKDPQVIRQTLLDEAKVYEGFIKALVTDEPEIESLQLVHVPGIGEVNGQPVDAVDITFSKLETMDEEKKAELVKVLGEDRLRFRIATVDEQTVVVTFGGAQAMLDTTVAAATSGSGPIGSSEGLDEVMQYMPSNRVAVVLLNVGNLFQAITTGQQAVAPESQPIPPMISSRTPIAIGAGVTGSEVDVRFYIPNSLIKEAAGMAMMFAGPPMPPPSNGPGAGEDF